MKPAFVVTVHNSEKYRPQGHVFLDRYLKTLSDSMDIEYDVFIMENASDIKYNAPANCHYHYFPDQKKGMTRAWNMGIRLAIENGNDFICITNEDVFFNETINAMFTVANQLENKDNIVFGPVCDNKTTFPHQMAAEPVDIIKDITGIDDGIHGWFTGITANYYRTYNINGDLFDPTKIWRGQERFQHRDWLRGARSYIIGSCLVHHEHTGSWRKTINELQQL